MRARTLVGLTLPLVLAAGGGLVAGCRSTGGDATMRESVRASSTLADVRAQVDALGEQLGSVGQAIDAMAGAADASSETADASSPDRSEALRLYTREVDELEAAADRARARWQDMRARAQAYTENWQRELSGMSTGELRSLSADQLSRFRGDFDALVREAKTLGDSFSPLMTRLQDLRTAMASNMSATSLSAIRPHLSATREEITRVNGKIGEFRTKLDAFATRWSARR